MATKLAIFSDIHANLPAMEVVGRHLLKGKYDGIYCLGDLGGYASQPNEVQEMIMGGGQGANGASTEPIGKDGRGAFFESVVAEGAGVPSLDHGGSSAWIVQESGKLGREVGGIPVNEDFLPRFEAQREVRHIRISADPSGGRNFEGTEVQSSLGVARLGQIQHRGVAPVEVADGIGR